jgi:UDP-2-acetamido-2,6-beta-L-arabino-hexul-4-ose reductase
MQTIGITGSSGFLGWHMRCLLSTKEDISVVVADRNTFCSNSSLINFVTQCDVIIHLAGINRGTDEDISTINPQLAKMLVRAIKESSATPHILYSSSTHIERGSVYGVSKQGASDVFQQWATETGGLFSNIILPNLFGEYGKPFYNSVVATFCYQLANKEIPLVEHDGEIELLHAQDACSVFLDSIGHNTAGELRPPGNKMLVSEMLDTLLNLQNTYGDGVIPSFDDLFTLRLFNTYRSYLYPDNFPVHLQMHSDDRGLLFEAVKTLHGGQAFLSTTVPGITRGDHFHFDKVERFLVVKGSATIRIRKLFSDETIKYRVGGEQPAFVDIPTLCTHNITNTGDDELLTFFWSHELYNPDNPDTYFVPVTPKERTNHE